MGWGNCGKDSQGRPIGYYHAGTCDHPGCDVEIDRGLAYACGGMHGTETLGADDAFDGWSVCEGYFCEKHLRCPDMEHEDGADFGDDHCLPSVCCACAREIEEAYRDPKGEWRDKWPTDAAPLPLDPKGVN